MAFTLDCILIIPTQPKLKKELSVWDVLTPPACASSVHSKMLTSLQNLLRRQGLRLEQDMGDVCLLTVIHSTRIDADITRDSRCLKGEKRNCEIFIFCQYLLTFFQGIGYQRLIMAILIPMREVPEIIWC